MALTTQLFPIGDGGHTSVYGAGIGNHYGPGSCPLSDTSTGLAAYVDEASLDESDFAYIRSRTGAATANPGRLEFTWSAPPAGIVVVSLTMWGYLRLANAGPSWWSADCTVYGQVNPAGTRYAGSSVVLSAGSSVNTNAVGPAGTFGSPVSLGVWTTNPATGSAWALSDLVSGTFMAGIAADAPNVPHSSGGGGDHSCCLAKIWFDLVYTQTSTTTEPIRRAASHDLRLIRAALRRVSIVVPALRFASVEPGDTIYSGTSAIPLPGDPLDPTGEIRISDSAEVWKERPLYVEGKSGSITPGGELTLKCVDLRNAYASFWWPMVSPLGVDVNDNEIARLDQGGGLTANRNQVGYSRRPDGLYVDRAASTTVAGLRYGSFKNLGLHLEGGGGERGLLNNTFSQWGGGAPTSWTRTLSGGTASVNQDTLDYLVDASGFRSSAKFTNDGASNYGYVSQAYAGWVAGNFGRVRLTFKLGDIAAPLRILMRRSDGADYNFSTKAWVAGSPGLWFAPAAAGGSFLDLDFSTGLGIQEWQSDVFTPGGSFGVTLFVGFMAGANKVAWLYRADLVRSTDAVCPAWALVPTVGAAVTQVADAVTLNNATAYRFLSEDRGTLEARFTPSVNHVDLPNGGYQFVVVSYRQGVGVTNEYDGLWYYRTDASNGKWVYQRGIAGTPTAVEFPVSGSGLLTAGKEYPLALRWTGSHGELGLSPYTLDLFVAGARRARGVSGAPGASNNSAVVLMARNAAGLASDYAGGWYKRFEVQTYCKTDVEILRRQRVV